MMKNLFVMMLLIVCVTSTNAQNVGIGETTPAEMKLHIKSTDSAILLLHNSTSFGLNLKTALYFKTGTVYTGSIATIGTSANPRMGLFTYAGASPNSLLERMSILNNGNVGVGTTYPTAKLEINGRIKITGTVPGLGKILESDADGLAAWVDESASFLPAGVSGNTLRNNGTNWVATNNLFNNGVNIGIGNTSPTASLSVARGTGVNGTVQFDGTTNASHFNYSTGEETYIRGGKATSQVIINDVSSGNIRLAEGGGNVGIGTAFPTYSLDVSGTLRTTNKATFSNTIQISGGVPSNNKVLTATDNVGNAVWAVPAAYNTGFRVFESSATTIPSGSGTFLSFNSSAAGTGSFDDGANFSNANNSYVAPANGVYQINATVNFIPVVAGGGGYLELLAYSPSMNYTYCRSTATVEIGKITPRALNISFIAKLYAGERIVIDVFNSIVGTSITTQNGSGSLQTTFSGVRVY